MEWPNSAQAALLFVIEDESDPQRFSIHRLVHDCTNLAELRQTDRVVPVVVFLRGGPKRRSLELGRATATPTSASASSPASSEACRTGATAAATTWWRV